MPADPSRTLRLLWPQWQGAAAANVAELVPELEPASGRRAYAVGTSVLQAVLPPAAGPVAEVPVEMDADEHEVVGGVESRGTVLAQLRAALGIIDEHDPERILTLGGECSVSIAPFSALAARHGEDLAVLWIDAHPDTDTPETGYTGHHAMAVSAITGHGDPEILGALPATVPAERVLLAGLHAGEADALAHLEEWGLRSIGPDALREGAGAIVDWLRGASCTKVAIHLDVDVVDAEEIVLGLGAEPGGLRLAELGRLVAEISEAADVVGLTIAEYVPRQVIRLRDALAGFPLL